MLVTTLIVIFLLVLTLGVFVFLFLSKNLETSSKIVRDQLAQLTSEMNMRLQESTKVMQDSNKHVGDRLDKAAQVVGDVQKSLGRMEEATGRVFEVGKDISKLQEILKAPKLRGALGELFLGDLLAQVLPQDRFKLQHSFKNGQKVDAVICSAQGLIPVDSKFPLENFVRLLESPTEEDRKAARRIFLQDVRKHIEAISQKYIVADEGTLDFALMYIPAENVYYEVILKSDALEKDLLRYAQERRVFPVSPNSFYAYLQTISIGFKGLQLQEGIREVQDNLGRLKKEFEKFGGEFTKLGTHLGHARGSFESADRQLQRLGEKLNSVALEGGEPDTLRILKGEG